MAATIDLLSLATVKILAIDESEARHPASGFLIAPEGKLHLVTNWHVMTGRNPSNRATSPTGALITHLEIEHHSTPDQKRLAPYQCVKVKYKVLDPSTMKGNWIEHKDPEIDVALLPIEPPDNALRRTLDGVQFDRFDHSVGDDIFVVGYPQGLSMGDSTLPLWKGGTVASEPLVPFGRKPKHLIDCDTYEGMSGSPVIIRRQSGSFRYDVTGKLTADSILGEVRKFFGVYSGRIKQQLTDSEVPYAVTRFGIVWSSEVIDEILDAPVSGALLR